MQCPNCRTSLPPGSRFCNGCGASMGTPAAPTGSAGRPGAPQNTQAPPPPRAWGQPAQPSGQGQPGYGSSNQTQYGQTQYGQQPGYAPPDNRTLSYPSAPPPAAAPEARKPIGLLIGAIVLLLVTVAGGTVMVVKGRGKNQASVTAVQTPSLPDGPGALQSSTPEAPAGPGLLNNRVAPPPNAPAVTGATKKPDDMAPSVLLGSGSTPPTAPSVVSGSATPPPPAAPSVLNAQPTPPPAAPPVTAATPPRPRATPQPAPAPAPRDHRDFERYLQWLQFVENERVALQAQGQVAMFQQQVAPLMDQLNMALDPEAMSEAQMANRQFQLKAGLVRDVQRAMAQFHQNVMRTKPPVPADCRGVDNYYMSAMNVEQQVTLQSIQAFANNDLARLLVIKQTGTRPIYQNLRMADHALRQVFKSRELPVVFEITDSKGGLGMSGLVPGL